MAKRPVLRLASLALRSRNTLSSSRCFASDAYLADESRIHGRGETPNDLTSEQKKLLDASIRIDHAGEIAANWIYKGQLAVLGRDPEVGAIIQVCNYFNDLCATTNVVCAVLGYVGWREETSSSYEQAR